MHVERKVHFIVTVQEDLVTQTRNLSEQPNETFWICTCKKPRSKALFSFSILDLYFAGIRIWSKVMFTAFRVLFTAEILQREAWRKVNFIQSSKTLCLLYSKWQWNSESVRKRMWRTTDGRRFGAKSPNLLMSGDHFTIHVAYAEVLDRSFESTKCVRPFWTDMQVRAPIWNRYGIHLLRSERWWSTLSPPSWVCEGSFLHHQASCWGKTWDTWGSFKGRSWVGGTEWVLSRGTTSNKLFYLSLLGYELIVTHETGCSSNASTA